MVELRSPEGSPDVWNRNGSESEGLGFNLCVAPSRVILSLILKDRGRIEDWRSEVGDDFIIMTRVGQGRQGKFSKVVEQEEDLRE